MACVISEKALLMAFHFMRLVTGTLLTYLGWLIFNQAETFGKALKVNMETHAIFILILGCVIIALALFGIFGTCQESAPLLYIYGGGMFLVMLGTLAFLHMDNPLKAELKSALEAGVQDGLCKFNDTAVAEQLQFVQKLNECCGWNGPDDYKAILGLGRIPVSCCGKNSFLQIGHAQETCKLKDIVYRTGCKTAPINIKSTYLPYAFLELVILFSTYHLAHDIGKKYDDSVLH